MRPGIFIPKLFRNIDINVLIKEQYKNSSMKRREISVEYKEADKKYKVSLKK
jgi:hypothetical protein